MHNADDVRAALERIRQHGPLRRPFSMHPHFTAAAMLQRVHQQVQDDFCV
jgi:hypothetical protein